MMKLTGARSADFLCRLLDTVSTSTLRALALSAAVVLAGAGMGAQISLAGDGDGFFERLRTAAGPDLLLTAAEVRSLIPPEALSDAEWTEFFRLAGLYGVDDGSGNLKVEGLINMVLAGSTNAMLVDMTSQRPDSTVFLSEIAAVLPNGLPPDKVRNFLLSIPRAPGGRVTQDAARQAIYEFVGRDGNRGTAEQRGMVLESRAEAILSSGEGTAPVSVNNSANIFVTDRPSIEVRSGFFWDCDQDGGGCKEPQPGGDVSVTNSGMLHSYKTGNNRFAPPTLQADSHGGSVTIVNKGIVSSNGAEGDAISSFVGAPQGGGQIGRPGTITIDNQGLVQTIGDDAEGISAANRTAGKTTIKNSGAVFASGPNSYGIGAETGSDLDESESPAAPVDGGLNVVNSGIIEMAGAGSSGINTHTNFAANDIANSGDILVAGARSTGITATTNLGSVSVRSSGDIIARAADSYAIFVVGVAEKSTSASPLSVAIEGGTVQGGSGGRELAFADGDGDDDEAVLGSSGVMFVGGKDNKLLNKGTITALNGLAISAFEGTLSKTERWQDEKGKVHEETFSIAIPAAKLDITNAARGKIVGDIETTSAGDTVKNSGEISGSIDLNGGRNALDNLEGGLINAGDTIRVGSGNTFTNAGDVSPGGKGTVAKTAIIGNFVQTVSGRMVIDLDNGGAAGAKQALTSDTIEVTGRATLAGLIVPNVISLSSAEKSEFLIVSASEAKDDGLDVAPKTYEVKDTVAYDFDVEVRDGKKVYLTATEQAVEKIVDAAAGSGNAGNTENLESLGGTLEEIETLGGGSGLDPVLNALRKESTTPQAAANALNRLTPQQQGGQTNSTNTSTAGFSNAMLSCASRSEPYRFTKEETCYYAKFTARKLDRDATSSSAGHDERGYEVMGGAQVNLGGDLRGGFALGYEDTRGETFSPTQSLGKSEGDRMHLGFVLKNQWGPINAYLNIAGSYGWYDHTRFVNMGGFTDAMGEQDVVSGLIKLRLSYLQEMGAWYVKPLVDVGATYIDLGGYTETGAGAFNLKLASTSDWLFSVSPALEIGGEVADASGAIFRPYIRGGVTIYDKDDLTFSANFAGAPIGVTAFSVRSELDSVFADVAAGVQILTTSGVNLKLEYDGRFGEHTRQNAGTVKVTMPF